MAAPRAQHVAADDRRQLHGPHETGWQPRPRDLVERGPEQVPALLERVGQGDDDALPLDQQVGQVVGDQVADGDRQETGTRRADPDEARDRERERDDDPEEAGEQQRLDRQRRQAEQVEPDLRLRQPVEQDRAHRRAR